MLYLSKIDKNANTARAKHIRSLINANENLSKPIKFYFYNFKIPLKNFKNFCLFLKQALSYKNTIYTRDLDYAFLLSILNMKVIFEIHQFGMIRKSTRLHRFNRIFLYFLANNIKVKLVTLTPYSARVLKYLFSIKDKRVFIIPDAGNPSFILKKSNDSNIIVNRNFTIGYAGSFSKGKGGSETINLAKKLKNYHFFIAGNLNSSQEQYAKSIDNLTYCGYLDDKKMNEFYNLNDILIAPIAKRIFLGSKMNNEITFYTSPLKLYEYIATDKPIITIDRPSTRQFKKVPGVWFIDKKYETSIEIWQETLEEVKLKILNKEIEGISRRRKFFIYDWKSRINDMNRII